jgi:dynein heavy chain 1
MQNFRRQHDQLRLVISRVLKPSASLVGINGVYSMIIIVVAVSDANTIEEVNLAYDKVKEVDALDISEEGQKLWVSAIRRYDERIERARITTLSNFLVQ